MTEHLFLVLVVVAVLVGTAMVTLVISIGRESEEGRRR
jgi:hypothetical protein